MFNLFRLALMLAVVLVVALAAALLQPEWASDLGLDGASVTALTYQVFDAPDNSAPDPDPAGFQESAAAKDRIIKTLIDGRLTLFEAAAHFRHWNNPQTLESRHLTYQCDSEEECLCLQVIRWVRAESSYLGRNEAELVAHFEEELRQHKQRNGRVILPSEPLSLEELDANWRSRSPRPE